MPVPISKAAEAPNHAEWLLQPFEKHFNPNILDQVLEVFTAV